MTALYVWLVMAVLCGIGYVLSDISARLVDINKTLIINGKRMEELWIMLPRYLRDAEARLNSEESEIK